ncbi:MAG TPA: sugar metabolism transcriptional regulator [Thiolapillus brandeum]|uniref:Sugar metabolism transcriptional regulator n=1 Tax=Thiolapillus brandeum TaxID=1076588 RepID=A0A831RVR5_9GAMM|nr:sugar metabolism transcriptional regulator [Thiolapillus brandeum]
MILSDISRYLEQRGQATLADIALHFDADTDAVRGMLEVWIRKGRVHRRMATASCGSSCSQCEPAVTEIYVWGNVPGDGVQSGVSGCRQGGR